MFIIGKTIFNIKRSADSSSLQMLQTILLAYNLEKFKNNSKIQELLYILAYNVWSSRFTSLIDMYIFHQSRLYNYSR